MNCLITTRVSGPCSQCGEPANPAHVDEHTTQTWLRCAKCCREHAPSLDWESRGEVRGEQQGLLEGAVGLTGQEVAPQ